MKPACREPLCRMSRVRQCRQRFRPDRPGEPDGVIVRCVLLLRNISACPACWATDERLPDVTGETGSAYSGINLLLESTPAPYSPANSGPPDHALRFQRTNFEAPIGLRPGQSGLSLVSWFQFTGATPGEVIQIHLDTSVNSPQAVLAPEPPGSSLAGVGLFALLVFQGLRTRRRIGL